MGPAEPGSQSLRPPHGIPDTEGAHQARFPGLPAAIDPGLSMQLQHGARNLEEFNTRRFRHRKTLFQVNTGILLITQECAASRAEISSSSAWAAAWEGQELQSCFLAEPRSRLGGQHMGFSPYSHDPTGATGPSPHAAAAGSLTLGKQQARPGRAEWVRTSGTLGSLA